MTGSRTPRGIEKDKLSQLAMRVGEYERELRFVPGSQSRITLPIDDLALLLRGARDGMVAHDLHEAAVPAESELKSVGLTQVALELGKSIDRYVELHPELQTVTTE